eukprot:COSAG06_NODE_47016_length_342_cov_1.111111_1_plen_35_part_01
MDSARAPEQPDPGSDEQGEATASAAVGRTTTAEVK